MTKELFPAKRKAAVSGFMEILCTFAAQKMQYGKTKKTV
jgi:hypothetical protein